MGQRSVCRFFLASDFSTSISKRNKKKDALHPGNFISFSKGAESAGTGEQLGKRHNRNLKLCILKQLKA